METTRQFLLVAPAALLLAACTSTEPIPMRHISLSAMNGSPGGIAATSAADLTVTGTGGSIKITSAQIVLSRIKLAGDAACAASSNDEKDTDEANQATGTDANEPNNDNHEENECAVVRAGPVLVDLPLDASTKVILDGLVPAGTYTGVRAKVDAVEDDEDGASDFLKAHPDFKGISVKVVGTFTDAGGTDHAFTFTSEVSAEIAVDFPSPVTVDASSKNLTVSVDVSTWFKDASGAVIDPTNAENESAIERSIRASFRAFEDDNHDGDDDHAETGH